MFYKETTLQYVPVTGIMIVYFYIETRQSNFSTRNTKKYRYISIKKPQNNLRSFYAITRLLLKR